MNTTKLTTAERYETINKATAILKDTVVGLKDSQLNKAIKTAFDKKETGFTFSYQKSEYQGKQIYIWGNGLSFDDRIYISFNNFDLMGRLKDESERELLMREIERSDCSDSLERHLEEMKHWPKLQAISDQIKALRQKAEEIGETIPEPKSATIRKGSPYLHGS